MSDLSGIVTDLKRFAVHDGDGIRTTVFLKGCPLKCIWCHNPEGISPKPELAYYTEKCINCYECVKICPTGAHDIIDKHNYERNKCIVCGKCEGVCPSGALKLFGRRMNVSEVIKIINEDRIFYETSGGGMTLSGGEPTLQPEFSLALLKAAKSENINTALDTCGMAKQETFFLMLPYVDTFLYDIKHITESGHIRCTGQSNSVIIKNLRCLSDSGARIEVRIPLVPGYNDDVETICKIGRLLSEMSIIAVRLLPYHSYAKSKYTSLGIPDTLPCAAKSGKDKLREATEILLKYNLNVITK